VKGLHFFLKPNARSLVLVFTLLTKRTKYAMFNRICGSYLLPLPLNAVLAGRVNRENPPLRMHTAVSELGLASNCVRGDTPQDPRLEASDPS
jgi:hypothetical protein